MRNGNSTPRRSGGIFNEMISLKNNPLFKGIPAKALESILQQAKTREYRSGEQIIDEGSVGEEFFFILTGSVEVTKKTDPTPIVLSEGNGFGEVALIKRVKRTASVRARENVTVLCLEKRLFDILFIPGSVERKKLTENIQSLCASAA